MEKVVDIQPTKVDAALMSAWCGEMEDIEMSSKLLFDLQQILKYYADFLVPDKEVMVDYPVEDMPPCASVDASQVHIPLGMLVEGKIDHAISSVIHELHHIKYSDGEKQICSRIFPYIHKILKTLETEHCGNKTSVWDVIQAENTVSSEEIIDRTSRNVYAPFLYELFGDLFLLMNAIEDVRIDELQPSNLVKYRLKHERDMLKKWEVSLADGTLDPESFHGLLIRALFHFKNQRRDEGVEKMKLKFRHIVDSSPRQYVPRTMRSFAIAIQEHAGSLWREFKEQQGSSAIDEFLAGEYFNEDGENDAESCKEMELDIKDSNKCKGLDPDSVDFARHTFGEDGMEKFFEKAKELLGKDTSDKFVLSQDMWSEIQGFKDIEHIICNEPMECFKNGIEYDTLIVDCVR